MWLSTSLFLVKTVQQSDITILETVGYPMQCVHVHHLASSLGSLRVVLYLFDCFLRDASVMTDSEYAVRNEEYTTIHFVDIFCDGNSPDKVKGSRSLSKSLRIPTKQYSAVNI
jgi:hypothetical protein